MYPENGTKPTPCGDACGTLPECAPLAVPYVPFQQNSPKRYEQMDALSNGTLYPGLNLPFRAKVDAAGVPQTPLTELQALEFVVQELALYLDTPPPTRRHLSSSDSTPPWRRRPGRPLSPPMALSSAVRQPTAKPTPGPRSPGPGTTQKEG